MSWNIIPAIPTINKHAQKTKTMFGFQERPGKQKKPTENKILNPMTCSCTSHGWAQCRLLLSGVVKQQKPSAQKLRFLQFSAIYPGTKQGNKKERTIKWWKTWFGKIGDYANLSFDAMDTRILVFASRHCSRERNNKAPSPLPSLSKVNNRVALRERNTRKTTVMMIRERREGGRRRAIYRYTFIHIHLETQIEGERLTAQELRERETRAMGNLFDKREGKRGS